MHKKILTVVGITLLFLGVGIQPAIADVSNISISGNDDDCNLCPKGSNKQLVKLKSVVNILENHDDRVETFKEMNVESNSDEHPKICLFLLILGGIAIQTYSLMFQIQNLIRAIGRLNLYYISLILGFPIQVILWTPLILFVVFDCMFYPY